MKKLVLTSFMVCVFALAFCNPAYSHQEKAQYRAEGNHDVEKPSRGKWKKADVEKRLETMLVWRLGEELELSEETGSKFFPVVKKYEKKTREIFKQQRDTRKALRRALREEQDEKLSGLLAELRQTTKAMVELKNQEFDELKRAISTRQLAKYVLFRENFRREIHDIITESRHQDKGPAHRPRFDDDDDDDDD